MLPENIQSGELHLRPFQSQDAPSVFAYWRSDPGWAQFNASVPADFQLADAQSFVDEMRHRDRAQAPNWAVVCGDGVVGVVSLTFEQGRRVAVIGFGVHGDLRGRGLAGQATSAVIDVAFKETRQLQRIRAHADARNAASMKVLQKLGFTHEGTLRQNQFAKGQLVDEVVFGLLRDEWD
ncbi:MAG: GNAT family protein [Pseudomonadota bacterium]